MKLNTYFHIYYEQGNNTRKLCSFTLFFCTPLRLRSVSTGPLFRSCVFCRKWGALPK
ncbi:hypothetical protein BREVNS_2059 [Brevinematales bacterium NS]|nr:hypothetical protein BREVNS_2059 [Brevinematales bacterium NS]